MRDMKRLDEDDAAIPVKCIVVEQILVTDAVTSDQTRPGLAWMCFDRTAVTNLARWRRK